MYIFIYIYIFIYMHIHIHIHIYMYIYISLCVYPLCTWHQPMHRGGAVPCPAPRKTRPTGTLLYTSDGYTNPPGVPLCSSP